MKQLVSLGALLLLAGMAGCGPREKVVKIALACPLTGDLGSLGQGLKRGVELALQEEGSYDAQLPWRIVLEAYDDRADPKEAVNVANRIVSDPAIVAVIGHFNSGCSIPAAQVYAQHGLLMMTPAASNPKLTLQQLEPSWPWVRNVFRVNTTDDIQGAVAAEFARQRLKTATTAILHDKTAYGQGIAEEFQKRFETLGGKTLSFDGITTGERDFKSLLTRIKATKPSVLYFGGMFTEGGLLVRQARELGLTAPFVFAEANFDPEFLRIAGESAEGAYLTFLGSPPELLPTAKRFVEVYNRRYPGKEIKAYDHYAYEVTGILLTALRQVGPDRAKLIATVRTMRYRGVLGETAFDAKGDTLNKAITLFQVKGGKFVPLPGAPLPPA
ncbi:MAG: branched-chain amino acid ABC transporter substrate-binding protein [Elusimicrobia bacterium]|nr:branched-chain amino acid ABC transporter substrate-binding protein [Elusimicrobiota bacterium]